MRLPWQQLIRATLLITHCSAPDLAPHPRRGTRVRLGGLDHLPRRPAKARATPADLLDLDDTASFCGQG